MAKLKEENETLRTNIKHTSKENISKNKQENKTKRVEKRQEEKTERKKYNIWLNVDAAYLGSTWICP